MQQYNQTEMKYFKSAGLALLTANVEVSTTPRDGIPIKSTVTNKSNVIVNAKQFKAIKDALIVLPVTKNSIHLYDQLGNVVSRMEVNRKANTGGTLGVNTEAQTLLSHMVMPKVDDGATNYLILQEYAPLNSVYSEEKQLQLLTEDINKLKEKTPHLKDVVVIIAKKLHETFLKLYPTYTEFFQVVPVKDENVINYVAEHICGKVIAGSKPSFQGFLNFGPGTNVIRCVSDNPSLVYTVRSGGRVQVNSDKELTTGKILAVIENTGLNFPYTINEEVSGASFTITADMSIKADTFPDVKLEYIISMLENFKFTSNVEPSVENDKINKFIMNPTNHSSVIKYLFTQPLKVVKEYVKLSDDAKLIVMTYEENFNFIKQVLSTKIYDNHTSNNHGGGHLVGEAHYSVGGGPGPILHGLARATSNAPYACYTQASTGGTPGLM
jgi:hypothetical protein